MHFDILNALQAPTIGYASQDDPAAGVTDTKVFPSIIYAKFKPKRSIELKAESGKATAMSFPQVTIDELKAALDNLEVRVEENPAHYSVDM